MIWITFALVGAFGLVISGATLLTRLDDIVGSLAAMLSWLLWAYGALAVTTQAGTYSSPGAALLGVAFAVIMFLVLLRGTAQFLAPEVVRGEAPFEAD